MPNGPEDIQQSAAADSKEWQAVMSINERPEFASAVRGYDRQQVDDYVQVLLQYIDELNRRALSAEEKLQSLARQARREPSQPPPAPAPPPAQPPAERALHAVLAQVADEARAMMEAARGQAEQVRAVAQTDAEQAIASARAEADQIMRAAHVQAGLLSGTPAGDSSPSGMPGEAPPPPPPPGRPPTEASVSYQDQSGRELVLQLSSGERFSIGRVPGSDIQLPWDDAVSRRHALFERADEDWVVVDDGKSSNGTFVNEEQVSGRRRLRDGDVVRAGATRLTYHERVAGAPGGNGPSSVRAASV
ncbi:MAG: FHA domain-containing protein [Frankiaceae bacterium]